MIGDREKIITWIIDEEGRVFENDPDDPGGATKFGITLVELRDYRNLGTLQPGDVEALTEAEAHDIYVGAYWDKIAGDQLPSGLDWMVMNFGVNAGWQRVARMLQKALGLQQDGDIGPETLASVGRNTNMFGSPLSLIKDLYDQQRAFYLTRSTVWKYGKGWLARLDRCHVLAVAAATPKFPTVLIPTGPKPDGSPMAVAA